MTTIEVKALKPSSRGTRVWEIAPTDAEIDPLRFSRRLRNKKLLLGLVLPVVLIVFWEVASQLHWIDPRFFPGPSHIVATALEMVGSGQWFVDVGVTLWTIATASAAGFVIGTGLGVVMGSLSVVRYLVEPILSAFYTIPKIALLPLLLLIFGVGDTPGYILVAFSIFFIAWITALEAVLAIPAGYKEAAEAFGVCGADRFRHVTLPAILPAVFVGARISVGQAVLVVIVIEYLMGTKGIGYRIWHSWSLFNADQMYVGIVTVALLGLALQRLVKFVEIRTVPWSAGMPASEK
jgi:NitT/TauT family transport system permease protein/sulfonate transport system permease protein